ncbi:MAG: hypothetical protein GY859_10690 [Desulfobacterales bacterium]|nr:hypothetical protein [Desulfobacterales bacterium]
MRKIESKTLLSVTIFILVLAFGSMWAIMPFQYLCSFNTSSPKDAVFTIVNIDEMNVPENEALFYWVAAEIKARIAAFALFMILYLVGSWIYEKRKE